MFPAYPRRPIFGQKEESPYSYPYENVDFGVSSDFSHSPQAPVEAQPAPTIMDAYREIMQRKTGPATDAYRKYLEKGYPDEADFQPSKVQRLGALLSGTASAFSGHPDEAYAKSRGIALEPYQMALHKYAAEGQRLKEGAGLEEISSKNQISALSAMYEAQNKIEDNRRQAEVAEILNKSRELGMKETALRLQNIGWQTHIDPTTGNLIGVNTISGDTRNFGKIGSSIDDRVGEAVTRATKVGAVTTGNAKIMATFNSNLTEGRAVNADRRRNDRDDKVDQRELGQELDRENRTFFHDVDKENLRHTHAQELQTERLKATADNIRERAKLPRAGSVTNTIRKNIQAIEAKVDSNPEKYKDIWVIDKKTQYAGLNHAKVDTPEYKELYEILYGGLKDGSSSSSAIVTKKGRKIE